MGEEQSKEKIQGKGLIFVRGMRVGDDSVIRGNGVCLHFVHVLLQILPRAKTMEGKCSFQYSSTLIEKVDPVTQWMLCTKYCHCVKKIARRIFPG